MTPVIGSSRRSEPILRKTAAAVVALSLAFPSRAWTQPGGGRRKAEPEANPQFQQQLQAPTQGGAPLAEEPGAGQSPAEEAPARGVQGVQIGAAPTAKPQAAATQASALDARVTVRVKGAPLATFLDTISAQAKVNFIITEGLEAKRVTAFLQNVTVREALQVLLEIKGLTYQQIGKSNTYVVTPRSKTVENLITRIYTLSYIPLIGLDSVTQQQAAITPQTSNQVVSAAVAERTSAGAVAGGPGGAAPATSNVSIVNVLNSILSKSGHVALEPRTNSLIVTDIPEVFPQIEQIVAELDKKSPQIMIEAQIVEINSDRTKNIGIDWGGTNGELAQFTGGQRDTSFPMVVPQDLTRTRFLDPLNLQAGSIISSIGAGSAAQTNIAALGAAGFQSFVKTSVLDLTQLKIALRALVSRAEARFLGKPKVLTLNNNSAIIQISRNQAVSVSNNVTSVGSAAAQASSSAERVSTGLILRVTPQVNKEGYITMLIQPSFTDTRQSTLSNGGSAIFDPVSRGASTLVRIKNGQTLVLGGLLSSTETKEVRKVPLLGYIPLIGWLFTSSNNTRTNTDLVIFITPTIVND